MDTLHMVDTIVSSGQCCLGTRFDANKIETIKKWYREQTNQDLNLLIHQDCYYLTPESEVKVFDIYNHIEE
jgi:hypothetical protein